MTKLPACKVDLYHAALELTLPEGTYVIELAPALAEPEASVRGTVVEGPVGSAWLGRFRWFRYQVRCWRGGEIPDRSYAVASPITLSADEAHARRILELAPSVPPHVWGRDRLDAGDMWNSNSAISWLLERSGIDARVALPTGGRAPGWDAGLVAARRSARLNP